MSAPITTKTDKILSDSTKKMEETLMESKLKALRKTLSLSLLTLIVVLIGSSFYMMNIKQYPEKIVEKPVDRIVEKVVDKIVNKTTVVYYVPDSAYVNIEIQQFKGTKKFGDLKEALGKADDKIKNSKMYVNFISETDEVGKEQGKLEVKQVVEVKDFIAGKITFTQTQK